MSAALAALRKTIPWQLAANSRPEKPAGELVYEFMLDNPAAGFMGADAAEPTLAEDGAQDAVEHLALARRSVVAKSKARAVLTRA